MWIGNLLLVVLNLPLVGLWAKMLNVPYRWLYPAILMFSAIGVYSVDGSSVDILLGALFGFLGWIFYRLGCEPAPFVLGFVLGPLVEENFRRSLLLSRGDPLIFIQEPLSAVFVSVTAFVIFLMAFPPIRKRKEKASEG